MAPIRQPIPEQRSTTLHSLSVSRMPRSQPRPSVATWEMALWRRRRSMISGIANRPSATTTSGTPSTRYSTPEASRHSPVAGAAPTIPSSRPSAQESRPLVRLEPDSTPTMPRPSTVSMKLGRGEREDDRPRDHDEPGEHQRAPNRPPSIELKNAAESARGLAALRHREAVEDRRLRSRAARDSHQDRAEGVAGRDHREQADEQRERRHRVHAVDERQQDRHAGDAAQARQDADDQADAHPEQHVEHRVLLRRSPAPSRRRRASRLLLVELDVEAAREPVPHQALAFGSMLSATFIASRAAGRPPARSPRARRRPSP